MARLNFPIAFSNMNYIAIPSHYGTDPVALTILSNYMSTTHMPVVAYDAVTRYYGSGWGINVLAIGT